MRQEVWTGMLILIVPPSPPPPGITNVALFLPYIILYFLLISLRHCIFPQISTNSGRFLQQHWANMTLKQRLLICLDCVESLAFLHSIGNESGGNGTNGNSGRSQSSFSHGDIKSMNYLVTNAGKVGFCHCYEHTN